MGELTLACRDVPGAVVIMVGGELDVLTAGQLEDFARQVRGPGEQMVIDLTETAFLDCYGLGVLVRMAKETHRGGGSFHLAAPRPGPARLLRLCRIDQGMPVRASAEEAVRADRSDQP